MPRSERQPRVTRAQRAAANRAAADANTAADEQRAALDPNQDANDQASAAAAVDQVQADVVRADDPPSPQNNAARPSRRPREASETVEDPDHVKDAVKIMAAMDELATLVSGDVRRLHPELADVFNCYAAEKPAIDERMKRVLARGRRQRFGR